MIVFKKECRVSKRVHYRRQKHLAVGLTACFERSHKYSSFSLVLNERPIILFRRVYAIKSSVGNGPTTAIRIRAGLSCSERQVCYG